MIIVCGFRRGRARKRRIHPSRRHPGTSSTPGRRLETCIAPGHRKARQETLNLEAREHMVTLWTPGRALRLLRGKRRGWRVEFGELALDVTRQNGAARPLRQVGRDTPC